MEFVKANILRIIDDSSYPTFIEFELTDIHGKRHLFQDKLPIVSCEDEVEPPCEGSIACKVINRSGNFVTIDTSFHDAVESVDEETVFEVSADLVYEWKDIKVEGDYGSEGGLIVCDEEYKNSCRITLERLSDRYAITCGVYGAFCHTVYCASIFGSEYERMKCDLRKFIDRDTVPEEEQLFYEEFVKKY